MSIRSLVAAVALGAAVLCAQDSAGKPPNLILIVADDLGYGELGCYGGTEIATPSLDSLARNGVRCTDGYVTCPVCAPTRAGLLTGRYQQRFGFEHNPGNARNAAPEFGLPEGVEILPERLRRAGYRTAMFGKWHLGYREGTRPHERGFDESLAFLAGARGYFAAARGAGQGLLRDGEPAELGKGDYLTDVLAREAVEFLARVADRPFFLYLPFNAVHAPLQATEQRLARFASIADQRRRTFAAMLGALDDAVGRVLDALREHGLEERTLVMFVSDNGGPTRTTTSRNGVLRGFKAQVWEGGIRVPFLLQWKGVLPAGEVFSAPVVSLDLHATALAAAGIAPAAPDEGVDLVPFVKGGEGRPHDALCWRFGEQSAVRAGGWKLVHLADGVPQLFDLVHDLGERRDLSAEQPDKLAELSALWDAWNRGNRPPRWRRNG